MHQIPILNGTRVFPIKLGVRFRATPRISKPCVFVYPWRSGFEGVVTGCHGLSRSFSDKSTFLVRKYAFVTGCHGFVTVCHAQKVDPDKFWHIGSFNHYCCPDIQEIRQKSDKHTYIYINPISICFWALAEKYPCGTYFADTALFVYFDPQGWLIIRCCSPFNVVNRRP